MTDTTTGKQTLLGTLGNALKNVGHALPHFEPTSAGPILVTSANGVVGFRVALRLLAAGYPEVRVGVKDTASVPLLAEAGAQVVEFDWDKEDTYAPALQGVKSVFCDLPHHTNWKHQFDTFFHASHKAGVAHFCKLSFIHALASSKADDTFNNFAQTPGDCKDDPFLQVPLVLMHRECDMKLMKAPILDYTLLFASHFMSNPLVYQSESLRKEHKFYGASGGKGVNYVSPNDVAEVAVRTLLAPMDHRRVGYNLTGPTAIKDAQVAELLSNKLGKTVEYVDQPLETYTAADAHHSVDKAALEYCKAQGIEARVGFVSKDVQKVCGHEAETYDEYLLGQDWMTPHELEYLKPYETA